jgi:N-acetylneuraminate synthase
MRRASRYPFVVAEVGANHNQDLDRAIAIVKAAKQAGCDAVKLQTYQADSMVHPSIQHTVAEGLWKGKNLWDLYSDGALPWSWHERIFQAGKEEGIPVFSTPFCTAAVDLLERLACPMYKIASFEILDLELIDKVTRTGKPVVVSTGMATLQEIDEAVEAYKHAGGTQENLTLLKCTSAYPAEPRDSNLATMANLRKRFECKVGISDHTRGAGAAIAAAMLGADMIEKHMGEYRQLGMDASFSVDPLGMETLIQGVRDAIDAVGIESYGPSEAERPMLALRRTLHLAYDVAEGEALTEHNVRALRPGDGMEPKNRNLVIGMHARRAAKAGEPLTWDLVRKGRP